MTATDTTSALLAAICADLTDDTVRLAFADHLDERGEPGDAERAEFIRVQCELDKGEQFAPDGCDVCGNTPDEEGLIEHGRGCYTQDEDGGGTSYADYTARYYALLDRELKLFVAYRDRWFPVPPGRGFDWDIRLTAPFVGGEGRPAYIVRRGFVCAVHCAAAEWLTHADAILASHPAERVTLTTWPGVEVETYDGFHNRLPGRAWRPTATAAGLLAAEWPGIAFHLPPS